MGSTGTGGVKLYRREDETCILQNTGTIILFIFRTVEGETGNDNCTTQHTACALLNGTAFVIRTYV